MKHLITASIAALILSACVSKQDVAITDVEPAFMPASIIVAIAAEHSDFTPVEVQKRVRGDRVHYDVEGTLPDNTEIAFDILMDGITAHIVEMKRDLDWGDLPESIQTLVDADEGIRPARIIESVQTDGAVIYEFFAPNAPVTPVFEIKSHEGKLEHLIDR